MASVQKVRIDIRRTGRRGDPLIPELRVPLKADLECKPQRLASVTTVRPRRRMLHREWRESQAFPVGRHRCGIPHHGAEMGDNGGSGRGANAARCVHQSQRELPLGLGSEVGVGYWNPIAAQCHLLQHGHTFPLHATNFLFHRLLRRDLVHHRKNPVSMLAEEVRVGVCLPFRRLDHVHREIAEASRDLPGVDRNGLPPELTCELNIRILVDIGQAHSFPRRPDPVDVLHHPGDTIDRLVKVRQLCRTDR